MKSISHDEQGPEPVANVFSYLSLLRRELAAVRNVLAQLEANEDDDELLRSARERLSLAIQYAGEVNRRYALALEGARRELWTASRSRAPRARIDRTRALVAAVFEHIRHDVRGWGNRERPA